MIILRNFSNSRAIRKMIERRVREWASAHGLDHRPEERPRSEHPVAFNAILSREGYGHEVTCEVEIIREDGVWHGGYSAPDPSRAILLALRSMTVVRMMRPSYATPGG